MKASPYTFGLDIGGTAVKSVRVTESGEVIARDVAPLDAADPHWPQTVREHLAHVEASRGPAAAVGVAAPGIARPDGRAIGWMRGRLAELEGLDWTAFLGRPERVPVLNDAQAALLGEAWLGAAAGCGNVVLLTLGTGVGGAAMVDGRLLKGHLGRAGHLGHLCLDPAGPARHRRHAGQPGRRRRQLHRRGGAPAGGSTPRSPLPPPRPAAIKTPPPSGHGPSAPSPAASPRWSTCSTPRSSSSAAGSPPPAQALFDPLRAELDAVEWRPHGARVRVVPAALGEFAGAIGAARNAVGPAAREERKSEVTKSETNPKVKKGKHD